MGYDVTFHLVDEDSIRRSLLPALLGGGPPPDGPFAQREGSEHLWTRAGELILEGSSDEAVAAATELAIRWSAASLPWVSARNLAMSYQPLHMEDELYDVSWGHSESAERLFQPLIDVRPELQGRFPSRLEGNGRAGAYVPSDWVDGRPLATSLTRIPESLRWRLLPILSVFRAAERHGFGVWEASDLVYDAPPRVDLLSWPGVGRFGLGGGDLTAAEWEGAAERAHEWSIVDLEDFWRRYGRQSPAVDSERSLRILRVLGAFDWDHRDIRMADDFAGLGHWLEECLDHPDLRGAAWCPLLTVSQRNLASLEGLPLSELVRGLREVDDASSLTILVRQISPRLREEAELPEGLIDAILSLNRSPATADLASALCFVLRHRESWIRELCNAIVEDGLANHGNLVEAFYLDEELLKRCPNQDKLIAGLGESLARLRTTEQHNKMDLSVIASLLSTFRGQLPVDEWVDRLRPLLTDRTRPEIIEAIAPNLARVPDALFDEIYSFWMDVELAKIEGEDSAVPTTMLAELLFESFDFDGVLARSVELDGLARTAKVWTNWDGEYFSPTSEKVVNEVLSLLSVDAIVEDSRVTDWALSVLWGEGVVFPEEPSPAIRELVACIASDDAPAKVRESERGILEVFVAAKLSRSYWSLIREHIAGLEKRGREGQELAERCRAEA